MQIHLDSNAGCALGDTLCLISLLCDVPEPVEVLVDDRYGSYSFISQLLTMLQVPKTKVSVNLTDNCGTFRGEWRLKLLSKYYQPKVVRLFNQKFKIDKQPVILKKYIGVACYPSVDYYLDDDYNTIKNGVNEGNDRYSNMPKSRPLSYYTKLFAYFKSCGFDIITLDSVSSLELKTMHLIENCAAVVGYEGGMAHLCHMLNIPYFMLNWKQGTSTSWFEGNDAEANHISKHVYHLNTDEEILLWSKDELNNRIFELSTGNGSNNRIVTREIKPVFDLGYDSTVRFMRGSEVMYTRGGGMGVDKDAAEFIEKFYPQYFPNLKG